MNEEQKQAVRDAVAARLAMPMTASAYGAPGT